MTILPPVAVGEALSPSELGLRDTLPRRPAPVSLVGERVRLRPLDLDGDVAALHAVSSGAAIRLGDRACDAYDAESLIWRYMSGGPFDDAAALGAWLRRQIEAPDGLALTVIDLGSEQPVGVINFLANQPEHLKIELGSIWYSPVVQGAGVNTDATRLLLGHAFALGYRRVEWKCDALNERSRRAALRMGFRFEGVQEAHYIVKGRNRDTAWYRMLATEWPAVEPLLRARVEQQRLDL